MAISCAPSEDQLLKFFTLIVSQINDKMTKKEPYDVSEVMKALYTKIAESPNGGQEKALFYLQEFPKFIIKAHGLSEEFADYLGDSGVDLGKVDKMRRDFKDLDNVIKQLGINKTPVKDAITEIVEISNPTTPIIHTETYDEVENKDKSLRAKVIKFFKAFPMSALAVFNQEAKTYDGSVAEDNIQDPDPLKKSYYNLVRNLNNLIGINGTADKVKMGDVTGIFLRLVPASTVALEDLYIEEQKYLERDDTGGTFPNNKSPQKKIEERTKSGVYLVYTDKEGNTLYFDEQGNITTKENGGKMLYTKMRLPFTPTKTDAEKGYVAGVRTLAGVQTIEEMVAKRTASIEEQEGVRKELTAVRNAEIEILDKSRAHIIANPNSLVLFSIRPGSNGYVEEDFNNLNKISSITLEDGFKPTRSVVESGLRQLGGVYFTVPDYPHPILIMRPRFSEVAGLSQNLAELLFDNSFDNKTKIKLLAQFIYNNEKAPLANDTNVYERDGVIYFEQGGTEYGIDKAENKQIFIDNLASQIVNINTSLLNKNFEEVKVENGKVVTSFESYNKFIADNFSTTLQKNAEGKILKLNAYNKIDPTPATQEILFGDFKTEKTEGEESKLEQSTPTDDSLEDFKKQAAKFNFGLKKAKGLSSEATEAQIEKARQWYTTSPLSRIVPFETMFHIYNADATAEFNLAGIRLLQGSNYTDLYHEAWHVFSQIFLTKDQKQKLYSEARNLTGSFTNNDGKTIKFKDATDIQLEEFMAEDYRKYILSDGKRIIEGRSSRNNIFAKIYKFLKAMFKGYSVKQALADQEAVGLIKTLYDQLHIGNINQYKPSLNNVQFSLLNKGVQALDAKGYENKGLSYQDSELLVETIDSMVADILTKSKMGVGSLFVQPELMNILYQQVKKQLSAIKNKMTEQSKSDLMGEANMLMEPGNIKKILDGTKTTTIRESILKGGNIAVGETKVVTFEGKKFNVTNRGHLTIEQAGGLDAMLESEGLKDVEDFMYKQSKEWAGGKGKMYVFDIVPTPEGVSVGLSQSERNALTALNFALENWGDYNSAMIGGQSNGMIAYHKMRSTYISFEEKFSDLSLEEKEEEIDAQSESKLEGDELKKSDQELQEEFGTNAFERKGNENSLFEMASNEVVFLIKSLPAVDKSGKVQLNLFGVPKRVDFNSTWGKIINVTQGNTGETNMYKALNEASETYPELKELVNRLGDPTEKTQPSDWAYVDMWGKFHRDFSVYEIPIKEVRVISDGAGGFRVEFSESAPKTRQVENKFTADFESSKSKYINRTDAGTTLNLDLIKKDFPSKDMGADMAFNFLRAIGLNMTDNGAVRLAIAKKLDSVAFLYTDLMANEGVGNPVAQRPIPGRITEMLVIEATESGNYTNNSIETVTGDIAYDLSLNSTATQLLKELNDDEKEYCVEDPKSPKKGIVNQPHMAHLNFRKNPFAKYSIWLNNMFNIPSDVTKLGHVNDRNKRKIKTNRSGSENVKLDIVNLGGIKNVIINMAGAQMSVGGIKTNELDTNSKFIMDIHTMLLQGVMELPRHASKSMSYGLALSNLVTNHNQTERVSKNGKVKTKVASHLYISTGHFQTDRGMNATVEMMKAKLAAELERVAMIKEGMVDNVPGFTDNRGLSLTMFDDILTNTLKAKLIDKANSANSMDMLNSEEFNNDVSREIKNYFETLYQENLEFFNEMPFLSNDIISKTRELVKLDADVTNLTEQELINLAIKSFTVNAFIHNTETICLLYGDLAMYNELKEDFHKRNASVGSTGRVFSTDQSKFDFINNLGMAYAKSIGVAAAAFDGRLNTAVFKDHILPSEYYENYVESLVANGRTREEAEKILEPYSKMNSADAQGWLTFDAYRMLSILESNWSPEQNDLYIKIINKEEIDPVTIAEFFPPRKFQYAGPLESKNLHLQAFHKFSLAPLVPSVIKGTQMETLHNNMVKQGLHYGVFESGSKLATITKDGNKDSLFEADNETITPWDGEESTRYTPNVVFLHYLKNQVDINSHWKKKTIFSTQLRTLIINDLFKEGVAINADAKFLVEKFEKLLDGYQEVKKKELLKEMGWEMGKNGIPSGSIETLVKFVRKEFSRQNLSDHQIDFIDLNATDKQLKNDLSLSPYAEKIEKLLNAIVIKRLIRQKMNGEQLVQLASSGFNSVANKFRGATAAERKKYKGTIDLPTYQAGKIINLDSKYSKFTKDQLKSALKDLEDKVDTATYGSDSYRRLYNLEKQYLKDKIDGKKPEITKIQEPSSAMKIKVAMKGDFYKLLDLKHNDGQKIGDVKRLNQMIRNDEWLEKGDNRKMITMTAVRIPVQGFNSMEFMEVYEFLPEEAGNVLIAPAEIVAKSGGDFDIDKLTVFMPNIGSNLNTKAITNKKIKELAEKYTNLNFTTDNVNIIIDAYKNNFEDYTLTADDQKIFKILESEFSTPFYHTSGSKGMENQIIQNIREILELPSSFEALIRPNDTDLVKTVADNLAKENIQGYDPFANKTNPTRIVKDKRIISPTRCLEPRYNLYKHESNNIGKKSLGIGAVDNGYSSIFKRIGAYLETEYTYYSKDKDGKILMKNGKPATQRRPVNIRMAHNKVNVNGVNHISLSNINTVSGEKISDLISQLMNGWVDIEKDAWIFNLNGNNIAGPVMLFMLEAGVDFETAAHFVSQPLVVEYIKERLRMQSPFYAASNKSESIQKGLIPTQARIKMFEKYGLTEAFSQDKDTGETRLSGKNLYATIAKYTKNKTFTVANLKTIIKNKTANVTDEARAGLLHFIELEEMCKQLTNVKLTVNVDTKPTKSLYAAQEKLQKIDELSRVDILNSKFIEKIQKESPKSSFFIQDFQLQILKPLMSLRGSTKINQFIIDALKGFKNQSTFPDKEKFVAAFHNDLPLYILQNHLKNIDIYNLKEYNGLPVNKSLPVQQVQLKYGAFVKDGVLYVDAKQIEKDFKSKAYTKDEYKELGLQVLSPLSFQTSVGENSEQNFKEYAHFVIEREYLRSITPVADGQSRAAYEADIAQRAMRKTFNFYYILKSKTGSMANEFNDLKNRYPDLVKEYQIFNALATPTDKTDKGIKTLKLRSAKLDAMTTNTLHENLINLSDFSKIKVADPVANREISNFFSRLIISEYLRNGITKGSDSLAPILPTEVLMTLMKEPMAQLEKDGGFTDEMLESYFKMFKKNWDLSRNVKNKFRNYIDVAKGVVTKKVEQVEQKPSDNPADYTNHSGGAKGSDTMWDKIGRMFGVVKHQHYFTGVRSDKNAPLGNVDITEKPIAAEGARKVAEAAAAMWGYKHSTMKDQRLIRNWAQVANSDAVFAIGNFGNTGDVWKGDEKAESPRRLLKPSIQGGTGYAVEMAIQAGKPVYVFDQVRKQWYKNIKGEWSKSEVPKLTNNFAGIGTREINEAGEQAIKDVYANSFKPTISPKILKNENGLIIAENVISKDETIKIAEQSKQVIEETSFKQTAGSVSWGYGKQWMRINAMSEKQREGLVIGRQLNGIEITQQMKEEFIKTGNSKGFPLYGYTTIDKNGNKLPSIPQGIINYLSSMGIDVSQYDASYNSVYDKSDNGSLIIHQDNTETNKSPIITISLGRPMKFITYELKDSNDFSVADTNNTAFRIAVNAVQGEALKLNLIPASAKDAKGNIKYGHLTPDTLLKYAEEIDKKKGTNLKQFVIDKLKEQFKNAEKTEYTLNNGAVLVFSGNNRNVFHEIVFDPETNAKPMEAGFPSLKINKAFKGLGQKDNITTTNDYRIVLTLRKVEGETLTNVVNQEKLVGALSAPAETSNVEKNKEIKILVGKNGDTQAISNIIERNKILFSNANISAVVSFNDVVSDMTLQDTMNDRKGKVEGSDEYIKNLIEFYYLVRKAARQNPMKPSSIVHGFQISSEYKAYLEAFLKYKGLPSDTNVVFFNEETSEGYLQESLLVHEAAHSFKNPGITLSNEQVEEIIKAFEQIAFAKREHFGISSGEYLKDQLAKNNNNEIIPVLAELYIVGNGYYAKKILTDKQFTLLESLLFKSKEITTEEPFVSDPGLEYSSDNLRTLIADNELDTALFNSFVDGNTSDDGIIRNTGLEDAEDFEEARDVFYDHLTHYRVTLEMINSIQAAIDEGNMDQAMSLNKSSTLAIDNYYNENNPILDYINEDSQYRAIEITNALRDLIDQLTEYIKVLDNQIGSVKETGVKKVNEKITTFDSPTEISEIKAMLEAKPNTMFIYPSNTLGKSENANRTFVQAENTMGIPIKTEAGVFMTDATLNQNKIDINVALDIIEEHVNEGGEISIPQAGLTSVRDKDKEGNPIRVEKLKMKAPLTYTHLITELYKRFKYIHPGAEEDLGFRTEYQKSQNISDAEIEETINKLFEQSKPCNG